MLASQTSGSNTFTFTANVFMIGNTFQANVLVTDDALATANSIKSGIITVNTALSVTLSTTPAAPNTIDAGQTITFNAFASGGSAPYTTYTFDIYNSITKALINSITTSSNGAIFTTNTNLIGNTLNANVFVTDNSAITTNSVLTSTFTVNTALTTPTIFPSVNTVYDNGQTITIASYETGGSGPYTYAFLVFNSITNTVLASQTSGSNTFTFTANVFMIGNTFQANVRDGQRARDRELDKIRDNNSNTALSVTLSTTPAAPNTIDAGQTITFNAFASGDRAVHETIPSTRLRW